MVENFVRRSCSERQAPGWCRALARRSLTVAVLMGGLVPSLGAADGPTATRPTTTGPAWTVPANRPWWDREGLVIASVNDVLADRAWRISGGRTREPATQERAAYVEERSEKTLHELRELGVTLVLVPYGGYGPDKLEQDERKIARETIERCHHLGLKCGVWLPVGQLDPSVWKAEQPNVEEWLVRSASGRPTAASGGRFYTSALTHPLASGSASALLADALGQGRVDAVCLPDWRIAIGHESGTAAGKPRLRELDGAGIPTSADSPLIPKWVDIRARILADAAREMFAHARSLRPGVLLGIDCNGPARQIAPIDGPAVDPPSLLRDVNVVMVPAVPTISDRQRVMHQIVEMKTATAVGCRTAITTSVRLAMAQQLAFGGDSAGVLAYFMDGKLSSDESGRIGVWNESVRLARAYRRERAFFAGMRPVADVLVYQPREARLLAGPAADVGQVQAYNALVTHRIPFSFCFDDRPTQLPPDAVVLVAGVPALSEDQAADLRGHVAAGGGLIVIGATEVRDSSGKRVARDLAEYLTARSAGPAPTSSPAGRPEVVVRLLDRGRVVSLVRPGPPLNLWLTTRKDPKNRVAPPLEEDDFAEGIRAALGRPLSVEGRFVRGGAIELTRDGGRTALHIVNFNRDGPLGAAEVRVRVPDPAAVRHVWRFPGEGDGGCADVPFRVADGAILFGTQPVELYDAYLIE